MWHKIEALEKQLAAGLEGTDQVDVLNQLAWRLRGIDWPRTQDLLNDAYALAIELDYEVGRSFAWLTRDFMHGLRGGSGMGSFVQMDEVIASFARHQEWGLQAMALGLKSMYVWRNGQRKQAFDYIHEALEITRTTEEYEMIGWGESILCGFYLDLQDYQAALPHVQRSEEMFERCGEPVGLSACVTNRGVIHRMLGEYELALQCHRKGIALAFEVGQKDILARSTRELGMVHEAMGDLDQAHQSFQESLRIREDISNIPGTITSLTDLGRIAAKQKDFDKAEQFLFRARKKAEALSAKPKLITISLEQAQLYKQAREPELALQYYEEYMALKTEVEGEQNELQVKNLQALYEAERSKQETEMQRLRNQELQTLYDQIERQQEDMLASIRYARGIQDALLPPLRMIEQLLPQGMVLYQPKDIVSGDFYWFAEVKNVQLIAAVDCTGHGVPGAFMVVISNGLLNEIVYRDGILEPAEVLSELDKRLSYLLNQREADHHSYDGLDIALVQRDLTAGRLKFAGAKRPLLCLRQGEIYRVKGNRSSIGGWVGENRVQKEFTQVEWATESQDRFFIFSDGYADQFGGPHDRKYGTRRMRRFLQELPTEAAQSKEHLLSEHQRWSGAAEQTDDLVIISWQEP